MKACTPTRFASSMHPHDLRSPPPCGNTRIVGTISCGAALCGRRCAMGNGQRKNCSHALTPPGLMVTAATKCRCMPSRRLSSVRKKAVHECGEAIVDWIIFRGSSAGSAGSVLKVEMDCDCCHTGAPFDNVLKPGAAHDLH